MKRIHGESGSKRDVVGQVFRLFRHQGGVHVVEDIY
jgi:hypothetical protein